MMASMLIDAIAFSSIMRRPLREQRIRRDDGKRDVFRCSAWLWHSRTAVENLLLASSTGAGGLANGVFGADAIPIPPGRRNQFNAGFSVSSGDVDTAEALLANGKFLEAKFRQRDFLESNTGRV